MKKIALACLVALALCLQFTVANAARVVWQGFIPGDGRQVGPINLKRGATYFVQVGGSMYFGRWHVNGRPLTNDPCYEFTARPRPVSLPILQNNLGINYCPGVYHANHGYRSANFVSDGRAMYFRIFDTDYRDNRGGLQASVWLVQGGPGGGPGGVLGGRQGFCRNYADQAVNQNNANLRRRCGFTGTRWQSNWNNHYNWCMHVSNVSANSENQARVDSLRRCRPGPGPGPGPQGHQGFCRNYANRAVNQNNANLQRRCGYTGTRWQSNWNNHYNWCMRVSRASANSEDRARVNDLQRCGGSHGKRNFCRDYAKRAVEQNQANLRRRCGYTGTRWQSNFNNHFNWCMRVSNASANSEDRARRDGLQRCRGPRPPHQVRRFNHPTYNGLPWDWCVTWATNCGQPGADDFCRKKGYRRAVKWGKRRFQSTWVVGSHRKCTGGGCDGFTFVDCAR